MEINPVSVKTENNKRNNAIGKPVSFGNFNPIILVMDGMDKGGFAASFIVQDFFRNGCPKNFSRINKK